jgi:hypothetical protein
LIRKDKEYSPTILECVRENFRDRHTCDQRSTRSRIADEWQGKGWKIDSAIEEEDTLFLVSLAYEQDGDIHFSYSSRTTLLQSDYRESEEEMTRRLQDALSLVFDRSEGHDVINITSHSGAMQSLFRAVHHVDFKPKTGGEMKCRKLAEEMQHLKTCSLAICPFRHRYATASDQGHRIVVLQMRASILPNQRVVGRLNYRSIKGASTGRLQDWVG